MKNLIYDWNETEKHLENAKINVFTSPQLGMEFMYSGRALNISVLCDEQKFLPIFCMYIDTIKNPFIEDFLEKTQIGKKMDNSNLIVNDDFQYPMYVINPMFLKERLIASVWNKYLEEFCNCSLTNEDVSIAGKIIQNYYPAFILKPLDNCDNITNAEWDKYVRSYKATIIVQKTCLNEQKDVAKEKTDVSGESVLGKKSSGLNNEDKPNIVLSKVVDKGLEDMLSAYYKSNNVTTGDISPEQSLIWDDVVEKVTDLFDVLIKQNQKVDWYSLYAKNNKSIIPSYCRDIRYGKLWLEYILNQASSFDNEIGFEICKKFDCFVDTILKLNSFGVVPTTYCDSNNGCINDEFLDLRLTMNQFKAYLGSFPNEFCSFAFFDYMHKKTKLEKTLIQKEEMRVSKIGAVETKLENASGTTRYNELFRESFEETEKSRKLHLYWKPLVNAINESSLSDGECGLLHTKEWALFNIDVAMSIDEKGDYVLAKRLYDEWTIYLNVLCKLDEMFKDMLSGECFERGYYGFAGV